jgi:LacI family transcriptional regulator, repressor for deo operon, udp, cdd, tsx, nupC, and nupG
MGRSRSGSQVAAGPATIKDVASELGMSVATVSRALSQPHLLRPDTRAKVLSVVERLGYRPNLLARGLRRGETRSILLVAPTLSLFFLEIFAGVEEAARAAGFAVLLGHSDGDPEREEAYFDQVSSGRADGIILLTGIAPSAYAHGRRPLPPLVTVLERLQGHDAPVVRIDHRLGAAEATRHLTDLGHRRIAHIAGSKAPASTAHRLAGYKDALTSAGIPYDEQLVQQGDFSMDSGAVAMERLLELENPPTAVFAGNDEMAFGAMTAAHKAGLQIPHDVSVVGFDDQKTAAFYIPALTTVNIPRQELGKRAAQELMERFGGRDSAHEIVLPTRLIIRESTAQPRAARKKARSSAARA